MCFSNFHLFGKSAWQRIFLNTSVESPWARDSRMNHYQILHQILLGWRQKVLLKHHVSKQSCLCKQQWNIEQLTIFSNECLYGINGTFWSFYGVLISKHKPWWDFWCPMKMCWTEIHSLMGHSESCYES